jgi:transglutaminase-like putative cysteine protease
VVKHYTAAPAGIVELSWEQVAVLDFKPAVEQLAAWVEKAEQRGLRYALHLPDKHLPAAQGPDHLRQCMEALADLTPPESENKAYGAATLGNSSKKPPPTREIDPGVPGNPLALMLLALAAAALPIYTWIDWRAIAIYHACILIRWLLQYHAFSRLVKAMLLQHVLRLSVVALGTAFSWFAYGSLLGIEPGLGVLLSVFGGKILEARTARDLQVLAVLGWFVCLCCLLLEQGLGRSMYALGLVFFIGTVLVRFRCGSRDWAEPLYTTTKLLLQAAPLIALLFFFFPRSTSGLAMQLSRSMFARTGLSENLDPASISELARSEEPAFRAIITRGVMPKRGQIYWRCMTLAEGNWFRWRKVETFSKNTVSNRATNTAREVVQKIIIEPHGYYWLPALDAPNRTITHPGQHFISPDNYALCSTEHVSSVRRYEVSSMLQNLPQTHLSPAERVVYVRAPQNVPERIRALADSFKRANHEESVQAALNWYRAQDFDYTLEPGGYAEDASGMEDFLFKRKLGFCGHFATSFATLMRLAGVPTRIVQGYTGGEYVDSYDYYLIRQSDAHVWCEVWTENGWKRLDPTAELVPARMTTDLQSYLGDSVATQLGLFKRNSWYGQTWLKARLMWDTLNYQWYERVVQFDEDAQNSFWHDWGFLRMSTKTVLITLLALFLTPLLLLSWWVHRHRWHPDPLVRRWQRYCHKLAKQGLPRQPSEGPLDYSQRVARQRPDLAKEVQAKARAYIQGRYAKA